MKGIAAMGAYVEHSLCMFLEGNKFRVLRVEGLLKKHIEAAGVDQTILCSDLGQVGNIPPDRGHPARHQAVHRISATRTRTFARWFPTTPPRCWGSRRTCRSAQWPERPILPGAGPGSHSHQPDEDTLWPLARSSSLAPLRARFTRRRCRRICRLRRRRLLRLRSALPRPVLQSSTCMPETRKTVDRIRRPEAFAPFLQVIKQRSDCVINITTGGAPTMSVEERLRPASTFKPEVASLNMGSMNFGLYPMLNRFKEFQHDWERPYLEGSRDRIFKNTFADIETHPDDLR